MKILLSAFMLLFPVSLFCQINPAEKYGELFRSVQNGRIFSDQKTFADCLPKINPDSILRIYESVKYQKEFDLREFVGKYFDTVPRSTGDMLRHIRSLWPLMTRKDAGQKEFSSMIALPFPYIVPGGRFHEMYYWDSYFTMLGLETEDNREMIENMVNDFAYLIRTFGHIPNGNRTYYLSRSQPPFFSLMVEMLAGAERDPSVIAKYTDVMRTEYDYWMSGKKRVDLGNGEVLNRYYDVSCSPRPESFFNDVYLKRHSGRDSSIYTDIRSAAESGWDFSSRWFGSDDSINSIRTSSILPVDLNCLLFHLETVLSKAYGMKHDVVSSKKFRKLANRRRVLIDKYFWNGRKGFYFDYDLKRGEQSGKYTLAGVFPLFFNIADRSKAESVKLHIKRDFLKEGGLVTTLCVNSGQQWDYPNGWAPLQWIGYISLKNYNFDAVADTVALRWIRTNIKVYLKTGRMMEKYDVVNTDRRGGGGEYKTQDGFGWTNGVFLRMWSLYKQRVMQ
ncbi:MAG: alpha,alpha-trehalase TreF [Bacteroidales bacterium]|jgi:alpha,alpha-trehalase|nr:alpha,alpha-trehalase TreF [Bacteroidales bacterium]